MAGSYNGKVSGYGMADLADLIAALIASGLKVTVEVEDGHWTLTV